ncbi:MAG: hypothetical protein AAF915_28425 [Cyanobacteria bacterium P01_D01_bin.50]
MATPNGTKRGNRNTSSSRGTNKNESKGHGTVELRVGKTRYGTLLIRVGCGVIAARYSENTRTELEHD